MKLYELKIEDNEDEVFAISLVESPAIESDFIFFDKFAQLKLQVLKKLNSKVCIK